MKKLIFLLFLGLSLFLIPPNGFANISKKGAGATKTNKVATTDQMAEVNKSATQMTVAVEVSISKPQDLSLDVGIPAYEQSFSSVVTPVAQEATVNYALKEAALGHFFSKDIRATWVSKVGVLSFKTQAKLTSSALNLDSKNQPDQEGYFQTRV